MRKLSILLASLTAALSFGSAALANGNAASPVQLVLEDVNGAAALAQSSNSAVSQNRLVNQNRLGVASFNKNLKLQGKNTKTPTGIDLLNLNIGTDTARYNAMQQKLTAAYGAPKSQRGGIQLWEIQNDDKGNDQSRMTTIMTGKENGKFFVTIDRRGNTGRTLPPPKAVISAPRTAVAPRNTAPKRPRIDYSIRD